MREISPAVNVSADEYLETRPDTIVLVTEIRRQKNAAERPKPSTSLIDRSEILSGGHRSQLLDAVAAFVDENLFGRSEMCIQFADLMHRALTHLGLPSRPVVGTAIYFDPDGKEIFAWGHAWVRIGKEVIDGNVDVLFENPIVPKTVTISPYWGPIVKVPSDRRLKEDHGVGLPPDEDVENIWWPELKSWLDVLKAGR